ncbi:MAG: enoyl-CoA hydratase/isomerase family protein [Proteobacteria bacterium]|nr:enoyl-CoA hydratase/isomerase family protein [Pseudomonadota bacterium]
MSVSPVELRRHGAISLVTIDHPPVNALSAAVVAGLRAAVDAFADDAASRALVIGCAGRTFVAGADIAEFALPSFSAAPLNELLARIEALEKIVVATMHGYAFGGGLELALACHHRVATRETQFAFPEVSLGLIPGSLGTQRLPRLVGAARALDLITTGRRIDATAALDAHLIDGVHDGAPLAHGIDVAQALVAAHATPRRTRALASDAGGLPPAFFVEARARASPAYPAHAAAVDAVAASALPFAEGERVEAAAFEALRRSPQARALQHLFFARRRAGRVPGLDPAARARTVRTVGIVGGGTMGRGIAMSFLNAGIPVTLVESTRDAMERAAAGIRDTYAGSVARGKLAADDAERRAALLRVETDDAALADRDLVIEAVYEDLPLKERVLARLGRTCKPGATIASNTSTLDLDVLARATDRPADVVGMHFFSPAHVMRLLEIVRGAATAPDVLLTAIDVARTLGKLPVVAGVCYGFIGNRMLEPYLRETEFLLLEGATPDAIDTAMEAFGMAMGPCRMLDMAGIDVGANVVMAQQVAGRLPADPAYRVVVRRLFDAGRLGQKSGAGYYRYEGRRATPDPAVPALIGELARNLGVAQRTAIDGSEIVERLLFPLVNEGARILEEGIASRASDLDVVWTAGYGFPDYRGGPMLHADTLGLAQLVGGLAAYGRARGDAFGYWTPSNLLVRLAQMNRPLASWEAGS